MLAVLSLFGSNTMDLRVGFAIQIGAGPEGVGADLCPSGGADIGQELADVGA